jgi:hypothetical protein
LLHEAKGIRLVALGALSPEHLRMLAWTPTFVGVT